LRSQLSRLGCSYLAQEPRNEVTKDNCLVGLGVARRRRNAGSCPQVALPLVEPPVTGARVEEQDARSTVDQPSTVESLDAALIHGLDGRLESGIFGLEDFDLDLGLELLSAGDWRRRGVDSTYGGLVPGAQQRVCGAILGRCDLSFGLEDRVDTTN
jgi:hypothetical protein